MDVNVKEAFASQSISLSSLVEASATLGSGAPSMLSEHALVSGHGQGYPPDVPIRFTRLAINYRLYTQTTSEEPQPG